MTPERFRKKPVVVEAVQWNGARECPFISWMGPEPQQPFVHDFLHSSYGSIAPGDWIVTGPKGERYPVRADVFDATYEAVAPASAERSGAAPADAATAEHSPDETATREERTP